MGSYVLWRRRSHSHRPLFQATDRAQRVLEWCCGAFVCENVLLVGNFAKGTTHRALRLLQSFLFVVYCGPAPRLGARLPLCNDAVQEQSLGTASAHELLHLFLGATCPLFVTGFLCGMERAPDCAGDDAPPADNAHSVPHRWRGRDRAGYASTATFSFCFSERSRLRNVSIDAWGFGERTHRVVRVRVRPTFRHFARRILTFVQHGSPV